MVQSFVSVVVGGALAVATTVRHQQEYGSAPTPLLSAVFGIFAHRYSAVSLTLTMENVVVDNRAKYSS